MSDKIIDFLVNYFVQSWPAFFVGVLLGAFASCRTYSSVVESIVLAGSATVILLTMLVIRRERKRLRAVLDELSDQK